MPHSARPDTLTIQDLPTCGEILQALSDLLTDSVAGGASVGFIAPLDRQVALDYWRGVDQRLRSQDGRLLVARQAGDIVGSVQIGLCKKQNGQHRGEIEKLMVKTDCRSTGIGTQLMAAAEAQARALGLRLLVLDTRQGDVSEALYAKCGFTRAGVIPGFALSSNGQYNGTAIYYKTL
ncbi:GNAT family N-acetyltransferase [Paludibacterium sp. THUN1379]|uniref:GNAT family N-acetyltransferase n=1 Tax=Paludibacterium sp. THUN1379 TaxID=3112107 RepID=UPI003085AA66|nr:GNAT family N-acetyltransferase [Paludibacterium sp. THUN1379]